MRWRLRRLMLDRRKPEKWMKVLAEPPGQVHAAGTPPEVAAGIILKSARFTVPENLPTYSCRRQLDLDRMRALELRRIRSSLVVVRSRAHLQPTIYLKCWSTSVARLRQSSRALEPGPRRRRLCRGWSDGLTAKRKEPDGGMPSGSSVDQKGRSNEVHGTNGQAPA